MGMYGPSQVTRMNNFFWGINYFIAKLGLEETHRWITCQNIVKYVVLEIYIRTPPLNIYFMRTTPRDTHKYIVLLSCGMWSGKINFQ